jgi:transposase
MCDSIRVVAILPDLRQCRRQKNRPRYDRSSPRYPVDLTDAEWERVDLLILTAKRGDGKRAVIMRGAVSSLMYVLSTGCQWRAIPGELTAKSTIYEYFDLWTYGGTIARIHPAPYVLCSEYDGREASPTAAVIDSQNVKSTEKIGASIDPSSFDAGKKIKGKKRHILVDTVELVLHALVHPVDIHDRDGGALVLRTLFGKFRFLKENVCRWQISGTKFQRRSEEGATIGSDRNSKAKRSCTRFRDSFRTMGCGADICMAGTMPEAR